MKSVFTLLTFILLSNFAYSQIVTELKTDPNFTDIDLADDWTDIPMDVHVENTGTESVALKWTIMPAENCMGDWVYVGCDNNNCYLPGVLSNINPGSAPNIPSELGPGESYDFALHVQPKGASGCCEITLAFSMIDDPDVIISAATAEVKINDPECQNVVGVDELFFAESSIYPNPVQENLNITNIENVDFVIVQNVLGRQVATFNNITDGTFDVSNLNNGMYYLTIFNSVENKSRSFKFLKN